jgi:hypothetical protein
VVTLLLGKTAGSLDSRSEWTAQANDGDRRVVIVNGGPLNGRSWPTERQLTDA